jgi:X-X-X-Leu-X-X-Gly heptad repeat protein
MEWVVVGVVALVVVLVVVIVRRNSVRALERAAAELEPVQKLAFEDVTALGTELQDLDLELAGSPLDEGARADYQRALDAYESAKTSADAITRPEQVQEVTRILDDGRYAIACVRARAGGAPLPQRRPACFFDPRHGLSVAEVTYAPMGGAERQVPACALDVERVRAGAEPDVRQVMVGTKRVPYWEGGRAYRPYAAGYFGGFGPLDWVFMGFMFEGLGDGLGALAAGVGDGLGDLASGIGDLGSGIGDVFDGFDF